MWREVMELLYLGLGAMVLFTMHRVVLVLERAGTCCCQPVLGSEPSGGPPPPDKSSGGSAAPLPPNVAEDEYV